MNQIQKKKFYHLGNIDKTLDKLNAQNIEHLTFLTNNHEKIKSIKRNEEGFQLKN